MSITQQFIKKKFSFGIACCRYNLVTKKPEILMMKKRYTYAFFDFVFAKYKKNDYRRLSKLFNQMSYQEKIDILSLDFNKLWCRIRLKIPPAYIYSRNDHIEYNGVKNEWKTYMFKKRKFEANFILNDKGKKLRKLINGTSSLDSIWEIPKGRSDQGEKPLNTAIREFKEETDISIKKYKLLNITPINESYVVNKVRYDHTYFIAVAKKFNWEPRINFKSYEQIVEVENLKWISAEEVKYLNVNQLSYNRIQTLFGTVIKLFKKN